MSKDKAHLLIVDDDARLRGLLYKFLTESDFHVSTADNAREATSLLERFEFDLAIVDVMMPEETGFELTQKIRSSPQNQYLPILLLTAMGQVDERIEGLSYGADDYLTKPFDPRELLLRAGAILRRSQQEAQHGAFRMGEVTYNPAQNHLNRSGQPVPLTTLENSLLKLLAKNLGQVLSRDDLADAFDKAKNPRTIDVLVTRLRRKIEDNPRVPRYLQTVRGKGYTLIPEQ